MIKLLPGIQGFHLLSNSRGKNWIFYCTTLIVVYGAIIVTPHYSADSFCVFCEGMTDISLRNGRFVGWLVALLIDSIDPHLYQNTVFAQSLLLFIISIWATLMYETFSACLSQKIQRAQSTKVLFLLVFVNISFYEGYFYFPETNFVACVSVTFAYAAIRSFCQAYRQRKGYLYILSTLLLICALNMYQIYIELYVIFCTAYIILSTKSNLKRRDILCEAQMLGIAFFSAVLNIALLRILQNYGIIGSDSRTGNLSLSVLHNNVLWAIKKCFHVWKDFDGFMPEFVMPLVGITLLISFLLYLKGKKIYQAMILLCLFGGCYIVTFVPHVFTTEIWCAPRTIYGFWIFVLCSVLIIISDQQTKEWHYRWIVSTAGFLLVCVIIQIQTIGANNVLANQLDRYEAMAVEREIETYETETHFEVDKLVLGYDSFRRYGYDSVQFTIYDTNLREFAVGWAAPYLLNFYTGQDYTVSWMSEEELQKYFGTVDYNSFDLDKQLVIEDSVAYWLLY